MTAAWPYVKWILFSACVVVTVNIVLYGLRLYARSACDANVSAVLREFAGYLPDAAWWIHGGTLESFTMHGTLGHYGSTLELCVEELPRSLAPLVERDFVIVDESERVGMMHRASGTLVYIFTRKGLGIRRDQVYPVSVTKTERGVPVRLPATTYPKYKPEHREVIDFYRRAHE